MTAIDLDSLRDWIGREEIVDDVLTEGLAARFHATLGLPGTAACGGDPAPRLIHFCLAPPVAATAALGQDGHIATGGFLPPVPLPRRMWATSEIEFTGDLIVGAAVRRRSTVTGIDTKTGRSGTLAFVTVEHAVESGGHIRVAERQTIVYRAAGSQPAGSIVGEPAMPGGASQRLAATAPLLFRYSALTFNTHRIHYDRDYARDEEGYPGLVVHGPLQATLLLHLAAAQAGSPPDGFAFRALSPLFDGEDIVLNVAAAQDERMALWTARAGGPVAMQADATWR